MLRDLKALYLRGLSNGPTDLVLTIKLILLKLIKSAFRNKFRFEQVT